MFINLCVCASFTFGFEGVMWDMIVLVPDHCCISYYATLPVPPSIGLAEFFFFPKF